MRRRISCRSILFMCILVLITAKLVVEMKFLGASKASLSQLNQRLKSLEEQIHSIQETVNIIISKVTETDRDISTANKQHLHGLTNYWPVKNGQMADVIGHGRTRKDESQFTVDRFGNDNDAFIGEWAK